MIKLINPTSGKLKCLIYGQSGVGKTSLAKTLHGTTLIVSAESGLLSLSGKEYSVIDLAHDDNGLDLPNSKRIQKLEQFFQLLPTLPQFDNLFVDSLTDINTFALDHFQSLYPARKDSLAMYGELSKYMRTTVRKLRDIPYNVFITALDKTVNDDSTGDKIQSVNITGSLADIIGAWFDLVLYMTTVTKDEKVHRCLVSGTSIYSKNNIAKDRSGKLSLIEKPDLENILNKTKG
jgi:phage nucleotide-binding protein